LPSGWLFSESKEEEEDLAAAIANLRWLPQWLVLEAKPFFL
jgi:hypothetical protein